MNNIETENYKLRALTDDDFEDVKAVVKKSKFLGKLWDVDFLSDEMLDNLVKDIFIANDNFGVINKQTGELYGIASITNEDNEGELSVRMKENVSMDEVVGIFAGMLKKVAPTEGGTNLTIEYSFE